MKNIIKLMAVSMLIAGTSCSSENKLEQTNIVSFVVASQAPGDKVYQSNTTATVISDAYNSDVTSVAFSNVILPGGTTGNPKITDMRLTQNDNMDLVSIDLIDKSKPSGFGQLMLTTFSMIVSTSNAACKASFANGAVMFGVTNPILFYTTTFVRPIAHLDADPYETSGYTYNVVTFQLNPVKEVLNMVIQNARFEADSRNNLNLLYESIPYTFDPSTGIITLVPDGSVKAYKMASNTKGEAIPEYDANDLRCQINAAFGLPSSLEFSTTMLKITSTLYEYGKLPNADDNKN